MKMSRVWAMPDSNTFNIPPIEMFVKKYLMKSQCSIDPFARNKRWATWTNDINPKTEAEFHSDAEAFLDLLAADEIKADLLIFDPPYSPRQISEHYKEAGLTVSQTDTQSAVLYLRVRKAALSVLADNAVVLSFGWSSVGMGIGFGFEIIEIMLVCHGGAHNDTICLAERKR